MLVPLAKRAIRTAPLPVACAITRFVASVTQRVPLSEPEKGLLARATRFRSKARGNVAWAWGDGPPVVLVHGWGGAAAQMAFLATEVASLGYRAIALDVTGHGESPGRRTSWSAFLDDLTGLDEEIGPVYAYIAHSAGALATMAARRRGRLRATRYVCVCAPSHPFPPVELVRKKLDPGETVLTDFRRFIAAQFETTWDELAAGQSFVGAGRETLLFYDETDRFVSHTEGDKIQRICPEARLQKTTSHGHVKVLASPELATAVRSALATS